MAEPPSDWFSMLKPGTRPQVYTFVSSFQSAFLDLSLFYECAEVDKCKVTDIATL